MKEGIDLVEHLNIFKEILDQLKKVDVNMDKEDNTLLLLALFANSYDNFGNDIVWEGYNNFKII